MYSQFKVPSVRDVICIFAIMHISVYASREAIFFFQLLIYIMLSSILIIDIIFILDIHCDQLYLFDDSIVQIYILTNIEKTITPPINQ